MVHENRLNRQKHHQKHYFHQYKYLCYNTCAMVFRTHKQRWLHIQNCDYPRWLIPVLSPENTRVITVNGKIVKEIEQGIIFVFSVLSHF